jgi:hypothetical protein
VTLKVTGCWNATPCILANICCLHHHHQKPVTFIGVLSSHRVHHVQRHWRWYSDVMIYSLFYGTVNLRPGVYQSRAATHCTIIIIIAVCLLPHKNVSQFTCTKQKAPGNSEIRRSLHNCGPHYEACFVSPFWLLYFWKICRFLSETA